MCVVTLFYETRPIPPAFPSSLALPSRRLIRCAADAQIIGQWNRMTQLRSSCVIKRKGGKGKESKGQPEEGLQARSCATLARESMIADRVLIDPNHAIDIGAATWLDIKSRRNGRDRCDQQGMKLSMTSVQLAFADRPTSLDRPHELVNLPSQSESDAAAIRDNISAATRD